MEFQYAADEWYCCEIDRKVLKKRARDAVPQRWLNEAIFWIAGFMSFRVPVYSRSMHAPHHTHTLITGRDPEIDLPRPGVAFPLLEHELPCRTPPPSLGAVSRLAQGA